jgi:hypothetical protein
MSSADHSSLTGWLGVRGFSLRQLRRDQLISFLEAKIRRWDSVWWNGELIPVSEALGRASELLPSDSALCSRDEVLLSRQLGADETGAAGPPSTNLGGL